jgi:hypothetical protein
MFIVLWKTLSYSFLDRAQPGQLLGAEGGLNQGVRGIADEVDVDARLGVAGHPTVEGAVPLDVQVALGRVGPLCEQVVVPLGVAEVERR